MESKPNYSELVQKYLADEMSKEEIRLFETELEQNKSLRKELAFHKRLNEILMDDELERFKAELDMIHKEVTIPKVKYRKLYSRRWTIVAAVALILISVSLVLFCERDVWSQDAKVFDKYYAKYNSQNVVRSYTGCSTQLEYLKALDLYDSGNYDDAKKAFQAIVSEKSKNIAAKFYLGIILIELEKTEDAILYFNDVIASGDQFYLEHSQWYKSLCLVQMDNLPEAMKQLKIISDENGFYHVRAEEIISKLQ